jgi:hypothetical protein
MSAKRKTRNSIIRGGLLAGAIFSFIPAFALVKGNSSAAAKGEDDARASQPATSSRSNGDGRTVPSYTLPSQQSQASGAQSITPSQTRPSTTHLQPRARTRAS